MTTNDKYYADLLKLNPEEFEKLKKIPNWESWAKIWLNSSYSLQAPPYFRKVDPSEVKKITMEGKRLIKEMGEFDTVLHEIMKADNQYIKKIDTDLNEILPEI